MSNYSALKDSVTELIKDNRAYYCSTPSENSLIDLIAGYSISLFKSLSSGSGVEALKKAVLSSSINSYLSSKPDIIVALTAGFLGIFIVLVYGIFFNINLFGKKKKREEQNSQKKHISEKLWPEKTKTWISTICISVALLIGVTIISIVIIFQTNSGMNVSLCNTWQILGGYFFGSKEINVLPGVSNDWRGSFKQHESVTELLNRVTPSAATETSQNILYDKVWNEFYGPNGLKSKLQEINGRAQITAMTYLLASTAFSSLFPRLSFSFSRSQLGNIGIEIAYLSLQYIETNAPVLLVQSAGAQMNDTMKLLDLTFSQMLQSSLSNQAILIQEAKETANVSSIILEDSNYLMFNVTDMVKSISGLVTVGRSIIFLVMALSLVSVLIILFYILNLLFCKNFKRNLNSNKKSLKKKRVYEKIAHLGLLITASFLLLLGVVFISLSIVGSDTCTFVNDDLITKGEWSFLPSELLESKSKTTNIPSILDVCLKYKGHGDIISNFGLRLLVEKLDNHAKALEQETIKILEGTLDKEANLNSLHTISSIIKNNAKMLVFKPPSLLTTLTEIVETPENLGTNNTNNTSENLGTNNTDDTPKNIVWALDLNPLDLRHISPDGLDESYYFNCFQDIILLGFFQKRFPVEIFLNDCLVRPASEVKSMKSAIRMIELMFEKYDRTGTYKSVCPAYLYTESKCKEYVSEGVEDEQILILYGPLIKEMVEINGSEYIELQGYSPTRLVYDPFKVDTVINTAVRAFEASDKQNGAVFLELISRLLTYDLYFSEKVSAEKIQQKIAELSNNATIPWNLLPSDKNFPGCMNDDTCTFRHLHLFFGVLSEITASALLQTTQSVTSAVETFVKSVVIKVTQDQVNLARSVLVDSNCQFLGSALRKTAVSNLCTNVFPNLNSLGILLIVLALTTTLIAFLFKTYWILNQIKISQHTNSNLQV